MSSYTPFGDDVLFGGFWSGVKKLASKTPIVSAIKFVAHPVKETKAAVKTVARFDPTSKTAKYSNVTKGALAIGAAVGATVLTAGVAGPGALALVGAALPGVGTAITPVRKPPKTIASTGSSSFTSSSSGGAPLNTYTDSVPSDRPADTAIMSQYDNTVDTSKKPVIGLGMALVAAGIAAYALSIKKPVKESVS